MPGPVAIPTNKDDGAVQISAEEHPRDNHDQYQRGGRSDENKKNKYDQRGETFLAAFCVVM
jgi:hypothetical protein